MYTEIKALINKRKLYSSLDERSYGDVLTCYNLLYGMPGRGYPYGILYRIIYSTGNLGIQMILTPPPPPPSPLPLLPFSKERNPAGN